MADIEPTQPDRRAGIRRTVIIVAACALASYALFFVTVLGGK